MSARHAQIRQGKDFHQLRCFLGQPWKRTFTSSNSLLRLAHRWRASLRLERLSSDLRIERNVLRFRWGYLGKLDVTVSVRGHYGDNGIKADFTEGICMLLRADTKRALLNHRERSNRYTSTLSTIRSFYLDVPHHSMCKPGRAHLAHFLNTFEQRFERTANSFSPGHA